MPSQEDYLTRREAYAAWLSANGVPPNHVPLDADVTIQDGPKVRQLRVEVWDLTPDGQKQIDERLNRAAVKTLTVPLTVEPPDWWQPYEKPTRDDLLELLTQIRELAATGPTSGAAIPGEWEFGWDAAMEAVVKLIGDKVAPQ